MPSKIASPDRGRRSRWRAVAALSTIGLLLAGCTSGSTPPNPISGPPYTLRVLASSELTDMAPILQAAATATGVTVRLTTTGSLAGTEAVVDGSTVGQYDATWFSTNRYLNLNPGATKKLDGTTQIMYSPVILGLRTPVAHRLGWDRTKPSWTDIANAAARGEFTFGMTDPAKSNSGLSALVGVATAVAGHGGALQPAAIAKATPELAGFFHAQTSKTDSSGSLTQSYLGELTGGTEPATNGLVDYESQLLTLNGQVAANRSLTLVYPSDGAVTADYPLSLLASAPAGAKSAYQRLTAYLRTTAVQQDIMRITHRRPAAGGVQRTGVLATQQPFTLPFPGTLGTVNGLIDDYDNTLRRPGRTAYVLDTSGSMAGAGITGLKQALLALTGADTSATGRFSQFEAGEQITLLPFNTVPGSPLTITMPAADQEPVLAQIRHFTDGLTAKGATAIYDSLVDAYQLVAAQHAADPDRIESIILLTDGENTTGRDLSAFTTFYRALPANSPPVFVIMLGQANRTELGKLAALANGLTFDAATATAGALSAIFEQIRGYQ
jgi:Ca-activated chloride channel family protein